MRPRSRSTRRALVLAPLAASLLAAAGCASTPSPTYTHPAYGTTLVYRVTSTGSYGNGTAEVPMLVEEASFEGRTVMRLATPNGSVMSEPGTAGTIAVIDPAGRVAMRYEPPMSQPWPLAVGKTATQDISLSFGRNTGIPMTAKWTVEGVDTITVPAGTFRAWRVSVVDSFGFRMTNWSVPDAIGMFARRESIRGAGHPQGEGTQTMELVRAPVR
jgi:hypothetical protein